MQLSDPLQSVLLQFLVCVSSKMWFWKKVERCWSRRPLLFSFAAVTARQQWDGGVGLFALFCCVAFYSTTATSWTGAWPSGENGCFLVSYILPFAAQHILASKRRFSDARRQGWKSEGGSQTVRVLQEGPGPLSPELTPHWLMPSLPGFWLAGTRRGALSSCYYGGSRTTGGTWPRGIPWKLRSSLSLKGDLSAGLVAPPITPSSLCCQEVLSYCNWLFRVISEDLRCHYISVGKSYFLVTFSQNSRGFRQIFYRGLSQTSKLHFHINSIFLIWSQNQRGVKRI